MIAIVLLLALLALDVVALRWGVDSRDLVGADKWQRRPTSLLAA